MANWIQKGLRAAEWFCVAFTVAILALMYTPVANYMARPLIIRHPEPQNADIIVVLGGGVYKNGVLGGATNERFIKGLLLYKSGNAGRIIFTGATIVEPSKKLIHTIMRSQDLSGITLSEANVMQEIALQLGLPEKKVTSDDRSTNTYENLKNVKEYMEKSGLKTCILVTSPTHMKRALLVSDKLSLSCSAAPVDDYTYLRAGTIDRLSLFRETLWEYAALVLYKIYGYI